jgi:hypothetical protein
MPHQERLKGGLTFGTYHCYTLFPEGSQWRITQSLPPRMIEANTPRLNNALKNVLSVPHSTFKAKLDGEKASAETARNAGFRPGFKG